METYYEEFLAGKEGLDEKNVEISEEQENEKDLNVYKLRGNVESKELKPVEKDENEL